MNYKVKLVNEAQKLNTTISVSDKEYILDAAERQGIELPVACRAGACVTCTARVVQGKVEQDHHFLKPHEMNAGFILTCRAFPRSDCVILTGQEDALLDL
ncbi:2Fe-2S iron-sulfur cluster-binding protein [Gloeothece verrucosa]|uniref:Ferredoxin (2Fe-2S) n=1 Tax=Gloeothece verrucosa (strain PCC 7822) TaxID=497965 RepID=E0UFN1_GLOV7|nr:2Fe-2S iron-sulfur cluster-binding protein [Gloeothece verrucosa]ADN13142.1 ferredoxin (2Fe-2S) [Gloeothece verrucosa PCC 7822]